MTEFKTEYSMRGWRHVFLVIVSFAFIFIGSIPFIWDLNSTLGNFRYIFWGAFALGSVTLASAIFQYLRHQTYSIHINERELTWSSMPTSKAFPSGQIKINQITKVRYQGAYGDMGDFVSIYLQEGKERFPTAYFPNQDELNRFLDYIHENLPHIKLTRN